MKFIKRDQLWESIAKEAYKAKQYRQKYEELEKELLDKLKDLSEDMSAEGKGFRFQKIERKGGVDYSSIPQLQGVDLDPFRKGVSYCWKLFKY